MPLRTRLLHLTDLHFHTLPHLNTYNRFLGKRFISITNLYLTGRYKQFSLDIQKSLLNEVEKHNPDLVVITGDLTALATPEEFNLASQTLKPLLEKYRDRVLLIPGNHDTMAPDAIKEKLFERAFGDKVNHSLSEYPVEVLHQNVRLIGLNPCVPNKIFSTGTYPILQLENLKRILSKPVKECTILASHYPILDLKSRFYHEVDAYHSVTNGQLLVDILKSSNCKPSLFIHGHIHRGYITKLPLSNGCEMIHANPGSSGYKHLKIGDLVNRYAAYNIYTIESDTKTQNGSTNEEEYQHNITIDRYVHNGKEFVKEEKVYAV